MFSFEEIAGISGGKIIANNYSGKIHHFLTDSRRLVDPVSTIFIAIRGDRHDGHAYLRSLHAGGVRQFMIEQPSAVRSEWLQDCNILSVDNGAIEALQNIAAWHRQNFQVPVIGITGSNGKTIIKEWLGQLLSPHFKIVKSPKSYNSQLGVPLSVLQFSDWHTLAIFEAGISRSAEMANLHRMIHPTLGIFTNIGTAHDQGFADKNQKALEKWKLFEGAECVIYCYEHELIRKTAPNFVQSLTWGYSQEADIRIVNIQKNVHSELLISYQNRQLVIHLPSSGAVYIENAMHCVTVMLYLNIDHRLIESSFGKLSNVERRLSLKRGINNCYLIDDSYNNDLAGLQIAIDFMKSQKRSKSRIILSDILQTGLDDKTLFSMLNRMLIENKLDAMIGIGPGMVKNQEIFRLPGLFYYSTEEFLRDVNAEEFSNETILIKGARVFEFEKIAHFLSEKIHGTVLEINLDALTDNLNFYRGRIGNAVKIMVMVKASAYGSGSPEIARLLQFNRIDYISVAYPDEGVELRKYAVQIPIMVMNAAPESYPKILQYNLEPEVYGLNQFETLIGYLERAKKTMKIHIKLDTGMHRLGFEKHDLDALVTLLMRTKSVEVASIYTHLAGADEEIHNSFSHAQVRLFLEMAEIIERSLSEKPLKHVLNSAGIIRFPEYQFDMVRLGIGMYGFEANLLEQEHLRAISTLKTVISQIRTVKKGETIGYGRKGKATRDTRVATIAIGYADGFSRAFSNGKASLLVNGKPAPVIGNVCMDMTMLDITGIEAREGDEVVVFGEKPTIRELAEAIGTIPYEILTNISSRVTRVFYSG